VRRRRSAAARQAVGTANGFNCDFGLACFSPKHHSHHFIVRKDLRHTQVDAFALSALKCAQVMKPTGTRSESRKKRQPAMPVCRHDFVDEELGRRLNADPCGT